MEFLLDGFRAVTWQQGVMYLVGFALIYLAIQKGYEPALLLLFIGIGAMIDFGPLLSNPKMLLFGAAAQFGIFFTGEPGTDRAAERMAFPCRAVPASVLCRVGPLFYGRTKDRPTQVRVSFCPDAAGGIPCAVLSVCRCLAA